MAAQAGRQAKRPQTFKQLMQSKQRQSAIAVKAVMWLDKQTKSQRGEQGKRANRRITQDIKDIACIARLTLFASQNLPEDEARKRKRGEEGERRNLIKVCAMAKVSNKTDADKAKYIIKTTTTSSSSKRSSRRRGRGKQQESKAKAKSSISDVCVVN